MIFGITIYGIDMRDIQYAYVSNSAKANVAIWDIGNFHR